MDIYEVHTIDGDSISTREEDIGTALNRFFDEELDIKRLRINIEGRVITIVNNQEGLGFDRWHTSPFNVYMNTEVIFSGMR